MKFAPDPLLGAGWFRSVCGRYRVSVEQTRNGDVYVAWLWCWEDLPEMLERTSDRRSAAAACERNHIYGGCA